MEQLLGLSLEKGHGAADWSRRPLPDDWLVYAALDVEVLVELRDVLAELLAEQGKLEWARQEFEAVRTAGPPTPRAEPWRRTSGIHKIRKPRALAAVRALWEARDRLAAERDIAPGRVLPDAAIVDAAVVAPTSPVALAALPVFRGRSQRRLTSYWYAALAQAARLDPDALPAATAPSEGPPPVARWADRDPAAAARLSAARAGIAALSEQWSIPAENLLQPDLLRRVCWSPPADGDVAARAAAGRRPRVADRPDRPAAHGPGPPRRLTRAADARVAAPARTRQYARTRTARPDRRAAGRRRASQVRGGGPARAGMCTVTARPPPGTGSAATVPPWACTTARTIESPSPEPGVSAVRSTGPRRNGSNSSSTRSGAISGPPELTRSSATGPRSPVRISTQPAGDVVPHRVLDEVPGHAFEQHRVAHRRRRCAVLADPQPAARGLGPRRGQGGHDHVGKIHRADGGGVDGRGHLAAGQQEQPGDQLVRPPGGLADHLAHPPELGDVRVGVGEGHVDLGPQHRQRRAQLVAGVGDEAALRVERRLQPVEHRVEARGQLGHLAPGVPQRQTGVERLDRQPARRRRDGVQRAQHPPDQPPRHDARRQHDEREGDQPGAQHLRLHRVPRPRR